jgi:hypothetical protein
MIPTICSTKDKDHRCNKDPDTKSEYSTEESEYSIEVSDTKSEYSTEESEYNTEDSSDSSTNLPPRKRANLPARKRARKSFPTKKQNPPCTNKDPPCTEDSTECNSECSTEEDSESITEEDGDYSDSCNSSTILPARKRTKSSSTQRQRTKRLQPKRPQKRSTNDNQKKTKCEKKKEHRQSVICIDSVANVLAILCGTQNISTWPSFPNNEETLEHYWHLVIEQEKRCHRQYWLLRRLNLELNKIGIRSDRQDWFKMITNLDENPGGGNYPEKLFRLLGALICSTQTT